jgi:hypothetical protein
MDNTTEQVEKLYKLALDAKHSMHLAGSLGKDHLRARMEHYLEADCGCISALTDEPISSVLEEVERRYTNGDW